MREERPVGATETRGLFRALLRSLPSPASPPSVLLDLIAASLRDPLQAPLPFLCEFERPRFGLKVCTLPKENITAVRDGMTFLPAEHPLTPEASQKDSVCLEVAGVESEAASALLSDGFRHVVFIPISSSGLLIGTWNLALRIPVTHQILELSSDLGALAGLSFCRAELDRRLHAQHLQLIESEKLAAVGRLVAGVAHELGGPLQSVITLAEVLGRDPDRDDRMGAAHRILRSALRCRGMVQDLLTYARKHPHRLIPVNVGDAVMDALELDRYSGVGEVQISLDASDELPFVQADPQRLTQVFLNLITNARHASAASADPGMIRVHIASAPGATSRLKTSETIVRVAVEDDGPGVPNEMVEEIFEPFVTTKPEGQGTGLGLSVSRSLVMDMGGALYVDRDHRFGARFVVELPAAPDDASVPTTRRPTHEEVPPDTGCRILLIDDDREVLETYEVILGLDDHQVTSCDRGKKALQVLGTESFDVILCDIHLPDIPGPAFLQALREMAPKMASRVVFATGDVVNDGTRAFLASVPNPALIKPFRVEDLQRAIGEIVHASSDGTDANER